MRKPSTSLRGLVSRRRPFSANGFGLISAIFLLVVLAGLGAAIVSISGVQHRSSALDIQGARAYQAARAGLEWGLYQTLITGGYCNGPTAETTSFALPSGTTLSAFAVTVTCSPTIYNETTTIAVPVPITVREITAVSCNQPSAGTTCPNPSPGPDYVQRVVTAKL